MGLADYRHEQRLVSLLSRERRVRALPALVGAMGQAKADVPLAEIAIGLDANVFLTLGGNPRGAEVVDYLAQRHAGPLILPGQVLQEFWNNQLTAVDTMYAAVKKKYDPLKAEVEKLKEGHNPHLEAIDDLLQRFWDDFGAMYSGETRRATMRLLEVFQERARVPFVSRRKFATIAHQRNQTKTPPGFKDSRDGDFYVWADFLKGLLEAKSSGCRFSKAVLVTEETKIDWVRDGIAHPILIAEVDSLLSVPFETWPTKELIRVIAAAS